MRKINNKCCSNRSVVLRIKPVRLKLNITFPCCMHSAEEKSKTSMKHYTFTTQEPINIFNPHFWT